MKQAKLEFLIKHAAEAGPIGALVSSAIHGPRFAIDEAQKAMVDGGYKFEAEQGKVGVWIRAYDKDGELKAQGFSTDGKEDAFLHAIWGAIREENAAVVVEKILAKSGKAVSDAIRRKLESGYITNGLDFVLAVLR